MNPDYKSLDFEKGADLALKNAKKHIAIAELASQISFGIANTHIILAAEESVKASILHKIFINDEWYNYVKLDKLFTSHKYKHNEIYKEIFLDSFLSSMMDNLFDFEQRIKKLSKVQRKKLADKFSKKNNFCDWIAKTAFETDKDNSIEQWWNNANNKKNEGLYIGTNRKKNDWVGPFDIGLPEYKKNFALVSHFISDIEEQIELSS